MLLMVNSICYGQKIKSDQAPYAYNKPPAVTIDKSIKNYQVVMDAAYETNFRQLQKDYEDAKRAAMAKYRQDYADYQAQVKAADARYDKEMAEYHKKSLGNKIIEGGKPVREIPQKPYLVDVPPPVLQQSYDYSAMGSTYINLQ